jgi:hypothetical protein
LFNKPSKDDFWKALDGFKRNKDMGISGENTKFLQESMKELFKLNISKIENDPTKIEIVERVKRYEREEKTKLKSSDRQYISIESIKKIINELKISNTRGFDGMFNNIIEKVNSELIQHKIRLLINAILGTGYTPKLLNRSIIIPIIKDKSKKEFDTNNFRPISVSNVFAQILEKLILENCSNLLKSSIRF